MEIKGKVHCFFEQSGTFKNEFIKLGIPAEDYDIQNNFGETNHVIDLFAEIEKGYSNKADDCVSGIILQVRKRNGKHTDLAIDKDVYDIEFELLEE